MTTTYQDHMAMIESIMSGAEDQMAKDAATEDNSGNSATDTSTSFMKARANQIEEKEKQKPGSTTQTNLGIEQTEDAKDGKSNVDSVKENSDADGTAFEDSQGTQTMTTDDKVTSMGNIGPMRYQETNQKTARAAALGNSILDVLSKTAAHNTSTQAPAAETEMEHIFMKAASVAQEKADAYRDAFMLGLLKRAEDEAQVYQAACAGALPADLIQKAGGIDGLLDKVA